MGLAVQVAADFFFLFVIFAGISILERMRFAFTPTLTSLVRIPGPVVGLALLSGTVFTLLGYSERLYQSETIATHHQEILVLRKTFLLAAAVVGMVVAFSAMQPMSLTALGLSVPASFAALLGWRQWRRRHSSQAAAPVEARNVLIVGAGLLGRQLARSLEQDHLRRHQMRGFLDDSAPLGGEVRGRPQDLARVARAEFVDEIVLTTELQSDAVRRVIWEARRNHIDVKVVPDLLGFEATEVRLERFGDTPVLTLCEQRIPILGLQLKRGLDLALSVFALLALSPVLAAVTLAVRLDSPGPLLYRAPRLGLKGRRFLCLKFRTMVQGADALKEKLRERNQRQGAFFKLADDPRVTRVGRFLRRYSLDELPQLWNVVRGDMSMVGPRPHPIDDFARYRLEDWQRLEVLPGITGLWQVTARENPSFDLGMALDREYISSWNFWTDLKILCRTVSVVLRGGGA